MLTTPASHKEFASEHRLPFSLGRLAAHYREVDPGSHSKQVLADLKKHQGGARPAATR